MIFLARNIAGARRAAFADVVQQARPFPPRDHARDILLTLADGVLLAHKRETVPQQKAGKEWAKILCAVFFDTADDVQPREILPQIDADIREMFVVL